MARTVLIIDDLGFYRTRVRNLLRRLGYIVYEADGGEDGCKVAQRVRPDVILLDQVMPGCDGSETLARLRECGLGGAVIVLSPRPDGAETKALLLAGAQGALPKAASPERIEAELRRLFASAAAPQP